MWMRCSQSLRPRVFLLLTCLALAAVLVTDSDAQGRRELRVGVAGVPGALDPASALEGPTPLIARQVFDTLVTYRVGSTDIDPALATRWAVSRDGLTWSFTVGNGVTFHDGTPVTAAEGESLAGDLDDLLLTIAERRERLTAQLEATQIARGG